MKDNIKEIAKKLSPQTSIEEMIAYCEDLNDFNVLFEEYCRQQNRKLSVFLAYILRHNPNAIGIELNSGGWANVDELITGLNNSGHNIDFILLKKIVEEDSKCRFSFNEDLTKIRANQGHSVNVEIEMTECIPPDVLYHGTAEKFLESIKQNGIIKKSRQFVHLSKDKETAIKVGIRHGTPVVLTIDIKQMVVDGYKFLISANGVWQSQDIPWKYVTEIDFVN